MKPFAVICDIATAALQCLRDWLHPTAFACLLSETLASMAALLLSVAKELALTRSVTNTAQSKSGDEDGGIELSAVRAQGLSPQQQLSRLSEDLGRIKMVFNAFFDAPSDSRFQGLMQRVDGVPILLPLCPHISYTSHFLW